MLPIYKPTKAEVQAAYNTTLPDVIAPNLKILFSGINPSLYSAAVGHHFARPGNRFWKAIHLAGFTDRLLSPFEDRTLLDRGFGLTNLAARATARADELTDEDLSIGHQALAEKVEQYQPLQNSAEIDRVERCQRILRCSHETNLRVEIR
jgi:double-stranded uracil-DNA glycosylase